MKKRLFLSLMVVMMLGAFSVTEAGIFSKFKKKEDSDKPAFIRFSWWGNDDRHQATLNMIKNFEANNNDVKVKAEYSGYGNLEEKITTQLAGGTEPDIMTLLYDWVPKFSSDGNGFYDLNKIPELDLSTFDEEFLKFGQSNGVQNAIPLGKNVITIALNKTAFNKLGLDIPTTWEEYKEAAKKFPKGSFPIVTPTSRFAVTIYLQQKTGLPEFNEVGGLNYSEADYKGAIAWYKDMVDSGVFCSRQDYLENVGSEPVSLAQNKKFIQGQYAGVMEWSGGLSSNEATLKANGQELIIAPFPEIKGSKGANSISKPTMLLGVSKKEKNPEAVGKFLNDFLNGYEANQILGVRRGIPESSAAFKAVSDAGLVSGVVKDGYEYAKKVKAINETPFYENGTLTAIFTQQMEGYELGRFNLDETAHGLYTKTKAEAAKLAVTYKVAK